MSDCPYCLQPDAQRILWLVKCTNPGCPKYDEAFAAHVARHRVRTFAKKKREPLSGDVSSSPTEISREPGALFRSIRTAIGVLMIAAAAGIWIAEKNGLITTGIQGKNLFWLGVIGFWIIPSRKKPPAEEETTEPDEAGTEIDRRM